jgi:hypothetical protein
MTIRIGHIVVIITVLAVLILSAYIINNIFRDRYNAKVDKYDSQFREIQLEFGKEKYDKVIILANRILQDGEDGTSEIRATCYVGLSALKAGQTNEAVVIFRELIEKYPGIKMVYGEQFNTNIKGEHLSLLYSSVLTDYIPSTKEAVNSDMTLLKIVNAMDYFDWIKVVLILTGSVIIYEKLTKKQKA